MSRSSRREGLQNLLAALKSDKIDVVIIFSTNRLYRKTYRSLAFVEEEVIERINRRIFVSTSLMISIQRENCKKSWSIP
jgi:site-specific DNA recombinase